MKTVPLRYLAEINPATPAFDAVPIDEEVGFLPLEAVWSDTRADHTRRVPKREVATGYTRFQAGDVVSPKVTPTFQAGRSTVTRTLGAGTTELHILRPRDGVDARWLAYAVRSKHYLDEGVTAFQGVAGLQRVPAEFVEAFRVVDHPADEQRRIADFLDDRVARIDRIIAARAVQIRLVRMMLRSAVAEDVCGEGRGWVRGSLRRFVRSLNAVRVPLSSEERAQRQGPFPYYGASGVIDYVDDYLFEGPRVLLSEDGANLLARTTPIAFVADGQYWVNNHAHILEPLDGVNDFWAARVESLNVAPWVTGSAQPKLTIDAAMTLPVSAPATLAGRRELGRVVKCLQAEAIRRIDHLRQSAATLAEYKQSLITAAVTGELDVTTAGSGIPG